MEEKETGERLWEVLSKDAHELGLGCTGVRGPAAGFSTGDRVMTGTRVAVVRLEAALLAPPAKRSPVTRTQAAGGGR